MAADPDKTPAEIMRDGILPCGHPAYKEEDKIILDHCFECGWATPARIEANKLNEAKGREGAAITELIRFIREENWTETYEVEKLIRKAKDVRFEYGQVERQREVVKETREKERTN